MTKAKEQELFLCVRRLINEVRHMKADAEEYDIKFAKCSAKSMEQILNRMNTILK